MANERLNPRVDLFDKLEKEVQVVFPEFVVAETPPETDMGSVEISPSKEHTRKEILTRRVRLDVDLTNDTPIQVRLNLPKVKKDSYLTENFYKTTKNNKIKPNSKAREMFIENYTNISENVSETFITSPAEKTSEEINEEIYQEKLASIREITKVLMTDSKRSEQKLFIRSMQRSLTAQAVGEIRRERKRIAQENAVNTQTEKVLLTMPTEITVAPVQTVEVAEPRTVTTEPVITTQINEDINPPTVNKIVITPNVSLVSEQEVTVSNPSVSNPSDNETLAVVVKESPEEILPLPQTETDKKLIEDLAIISSGGHLQIDPRYETGLDYYTLLARKVSRQAINTDTLEFSKKREEITDWYQNIKSDVHLYLVRGCKKLNIPEDEIPSLKEAVMCSLTYRVGRQISFKGEGILNKTTVKEVYENSIIGEQISKHFRNSSEKAEEALLKEEIKNGKFLHVIINFLHRETTINDQLEGYEKKQKKPL